MVPHMADLITEFERDCDRAGVKPTAILKAAAVHPSLWWKWKEGKVSPTLRNFEAARNKLDELTGGDERQKAP
jgi:hypothetical protein